MIKAQHICLAKIQKTSTFQQLKRKGSHKHTKPEKALN